jgi:hypothetical protein
MHRVEDATTKRHEASRPKCKVRRECCMGPQQLSGVERRQCVVRRWMRLGENAHRLGSNCWLTHALSLLQVRRPAESDNKNVAQALGFCFGLASSHSTAADADRVRDNNAAASLIHQGFVHTCEANRNGQKRLR